jgi:hypothetical protein
MRATLFASALALFVLCAAPQAVAGSSGAPAELVEVHKIWDKAPHNAFTDLVRFKGRWFCVFREGAAHVSPDGALRVITSEDGKAWTSAALLTSKTADLRDAKITVTPDGKLMLGGAGALHPPSKIRHQSLVWFSDDGYHWSDPVEIGDPNMWVWRHTWHDGQVYSIGYNTTGENFIRLYTSRDGKHFTTLVERLFDKGEPNETSLLFRDDGTCLCLLRRDGSEPSAQLGRSSPPYTEWSWRDLGVAVGGPHMLELPDGRIVAAGRRYEGGARTVLYELDPENAHLHELLVFPSGGDTSYPGLVWHDGLLWVSYYSSHEGKTSIYLAKVKLGDAGV